MGFGSCIGSGDGTRVLALRYRFWYWYRSSSRHRTNSGTLGNKILMVYLKPGCWVTVWTPKPGGGRFRAVASLSAPEGNSEVQAYL